MKTKFSFNPLSGEFDLVTSELNAAEVVNVPSGNLAATDAQSALNELQSDIDTRATSSALTAHTGASSGVHGVTGSVVGTSDTQNLTNKTLDDTSNALLKGGNTTGADLIVGTNDAQDLAFETNGSIVARFWRSSQRASFGDFRFEGTAGMKFPAGTVAQRPSTPPAGMVRLNTDSSEFEGFTNGVWQPIGAGLNEQPLKNYLKTYATAAVLPGTLSTVAAGGNIATTAGLFYADTTSGSSALSTSPSTALRGSTDYLSALSGSDTAGGRFFQFPAFALESSDLGKPVSLSFDITGLTALGWDVVVARYNASGTFQGLIPVAGTASASTSTPSASLPTGTFRDFPGFFVSTSTAGDLYAIRFRRISGAEQIRLDTLYVGPQTQLSGAAVTDWQSYTPTGVYTTNSTYTGRHRRVGDSIELQIDIAFSGAPNAASAQFTFTGLLNGLGLTVDTTKFPNTGDVQIPVGTWGALDSGLAAYGGPALFAGASSIELWNSASGTLVSNTSPFNFNTNDNLSLNIRLPIANWSSNTTMAERAVEEYAWNSTTTDADNIFSFGNGASGVQFGSFTALRQKRVRFQTPIQATDKIFLEFTANSGISWQEVSNSTTAIVPFQAQTTTTYGMGWQGLTGNNTDVDVYFGTYRTISTGVYGAVGPAWSGIAASSTYLWRVRKVSGGAAVGYPVNDVNVLRLRENVSTTGNIDNLAASSGVTVIKFTGANPVLRGLASSRTDGQIVTLISATSGSLVINNQDAGSSAENRIITGSGAAITITTDGSASLIYDGDTQRWRVIGVVQ